MAQGTRLATCDIKFSNNRGTTLRTPCGEKESALNGEMYFRGDQGRNISDLASEGAIEIYREGSG
jgi:hypothetical protein